MDLCGIALASHAEAGKSFAFVLSFFDNSSITFAADSLGLYYKILLIKNVLYVVYYHSSMTFAADSLGLLSDMRVFVCVCIHAYNKYIYVCIYMCMYVHMFAYIYFCVYIYTHMIYIHIYIQVCNRSRTHTIWHVQRSEAGG